MKKFSILMLSSMILMSLVFSGWAQSSSPKVLRVLANVDLDTLDPHNVWALPTYTYMLTPIFDTLVTKTEELEVIPSLATKWSVSSDGKEWTFHLRKGVRFHDGEPFNAHAVKANVDRITNPKKFLAAKILYFKGVKADVVDDYTVRLVTVTPIADMLNNLASIGSCMASPKSLELLEKGEKVYPVGTGPFRFTEYKQGEGWTEEANLQYWGEKPFFDKIITKVAPESFTRALMLETGETDLAVNFSPKDYERLKQKGEVAVEITRTVSRLYIGLNTQRKPFTDVRVRQALNYAIDKDAILKNVLGGVGRVLDSPINASQGKYYLKLDGYPYNPGKAKELLREAGYPEGFEVSLVYTPGRYLADTQIVQAIQGYLSQVKVKINLVPLEWATNMANLKDPKKSAEVDMHLMSWGNVGLDSDISPRIHSSNWPPGGNYGRYKNEEVDKWLDTAKGELNQGKRIELYHRIQRQIMKDAPWLFLFERPEVAGWNKKLKGIVLQLLNIVNYNHAYFPEK